MRGAARSRARYFAAAWLATAVLVALCAYIVWSQREESRRIAEVTLRNSAVLLAEQVESDFEQADALLRSVAFRYAQAKDGSASRLDALLAEVRHDVTANPYIKRIGIVDEAGVNFFNTGFTDNSAPRPVALERAYFRRAAAGERGLIFDGPLLPKLVPEWSLVLARRVEGADGAFLGVVFAALPVESIGAAFSKVDLGPSGIVNLRTADLAQVVRVPLLAGDQSGTGNRNVSQTIRDLMRHTAGLVEGNGATGPLGELYRRADPENLDHTLAEEVRRMAGVPLLYQPGTRWLYSPSVEVQARLVEVLSG